MSQQPQEQEQNTIWQRNARWMRIAVLTMTTLGPVIKAASEMMQRRAQSQRDEAVKRGKKFIAATQEAGEDTQAELQRRFEDFSATSRQIAADQARHLQEQARQLRSQAQSLRRALRNEARQRAQLQKIVKQVQEKSADWSQELLSRGEDFRGNLLAQTGKISQEVRERGSAMTEGLAERGGQLLQPVRQRPRFIVLLAGFGVGLAAAASVTYIMIRRRIAAQMPEEDEQIELQSHGQNNTGAPESQSQPAGAIRRVDSEAAPVVATMPKTSVETEVKAPYVGFKSTHHYYTLAAFKELFPDFDAQANAHDITYFASEDEAKAQGYTLE